MELQQFATLSPKTLALFLATAYVLLQLITAAITTYQDRKFARANGCRAPRRWYSGPYGLIEFRRFMQAANKGQHVEYVASRWEKFGAHTFAMRSFSTEIINTIDPRNIQTILATKFKDFSLGPARRNGFHALFGEGIFTLDGKGWEYSRTLLRPQFSRDQVADVDMLDTHVTRLLNLMKEAGSEPVDLQPWFFSLTLDSATEFLFGESADSLLMGDQAGFAYAFNRGLEWVMWKLRFRKLAQLYEPKEMREVNAMVHGFVDRYVDMALNRDKHPLPKEAEDKYIFLDAVVADTRDRKALRDQMLNILLAGRDTTAGLIGWTIYCLAWHPHVYRKLRAELEKAFGTATPGVWKRPTFESLKDVVYLRHVLNEVLRLYPSVPLNSRDAIRDTILPAGGGPDGHSPIFIKKGTRVQYSVYQLHRRKDIYGPDANEFRPERWAEAKVGRGWDYLPFNGGPRICLGQQYALTEAGFTVTRILQHFESITPGDPSVTYPHMLSTLTMSPLRCFVKMVPVRRDN